MKKKHIILIPNATSPRNVGNQAIMSVLVSFLKETYKGCEIVMQGFDPQLQTDPVRSVGQSLYSWAIFANPNPFVRIYRLFCVFLGISGFSHLPKELSRMLHEYKEADLVVLEPGGYLTTRSGLSQTLNFFMQLLPLYYSLRLKKNIIQAPCSVGSFAYAWQERIVCSLFRRVDRVFVREDISYDFLKRNGVFVEKSADLVFFSRITRQIKKKRKTIGVVMRQWSANDVQLRLEEKIASSVATFAKKNGYSIIPIVQSHATEYRDFDKESVLRVRHLLEQAGIRVHPLQMITTPKEARKTYGGLDMLVGMRMHAALFALMDGVPAIVITDEIKAKGIFAMLGIQKLAVSLHSTDLSDALRYIADNKKKIQRTVASSIRAIRKNKLRLTKRPTVTIAISAHNEEKNIVPFLRSVLRQKEEGYAMSRIVVVSDGSTDKTVSKARAIRNKKIKIREFKQRQGKSLHLNVIYKSLKTDYLIQSDADVIFTTPFVVRDIVNTMHKNQEVGLCGGNPTPLPAETFIERGINSTVSAYQRLRFMVRRSNNPFSADGRLLGLSRDFAKSITIPSDMIANDRYVYYLCKSGGWQYRFVPSAVVHFRSPQTLQDHIRQNTRFVAAPMRMERYFSRSLIVKEESIPWYLRMFVFLEQWIQNPLGMTVVITVNRYCELRAKKSEKRLTALWDIATSTKHL